MKVCTFRGESRLKNTTITIWWWSQWYFYKAKHTLYFPTNTPSSARTFLKWHIDSSVFNIAADAETHSSCFQKHSIMDKLTMTKMFLSYSSVSRKTQMTWLNFSVLLYLPILKQCSVLKGTWLITEACEVLPCWTEDGRLHQNHLKLETH